MNKEIKNKFENYEVKPPESVLNNIKHDLGFSKQPFLVKHKYSVAVSLVGAVIGMFILLNNQENKTLTENVADNVQQTEVAIDINNDKQEEKTELKNNNKSVNTQTESKIINETKIVEEKQEFVKVPKLIINNKKLISVLNAGNDISVCGTQCKIGEDSNAKSGKWLQANNIIFADIYNPNTKITSSSFGSFYIIWAEKMESTYVYDTISVEFKETPSNIIVNKTNENCGNSDAIVEFVNLKGNYSFKWNDETISNPVKNNLSSGNYSVVVTNNEACSYTYNIDIENTEPITADFFHTELYSAIGTPFYFTNRSITTLSDNDDLDYFWDFGDGTNSTEENPNHTYEKAGEYIITLVVSENGSCSSEKQSTINVDEILNAMPNIFTPNADGINDILVINPKPLANFKGMVFTKSGELVYEWNNQYEGWDGKLKNGELAIEGVYYYVVTGVDNEGKKFQYRSFVHLSR